MESEASLHALLEVVELASLAIELLAIGIIIVAISVGTYQYVAGHLRREERGAVYFAYRERLAKALLIGLEVLVAADVIRTVALEPTLESISVLGLLVLIRTFLSWSLVVELEGHWPWHGHQIAEKASDKLQATSAPESSGEPPERS